jgi:hypothetical protein
MQFSSIHDRRTARALAVILAVTSVILLWLALDVAALGIHSTSSPLEVLEAVVTFGLAAAAAAWAAWHVDGSVRVDILAGELDLFHRSVSRRSALKAAGILALMGCAWILFGLAMSLVVVDLFAPPDFVFGATLASPGAALLCAAILLFNRVRRTIPLQTT